MQRILEGINADTQLRNIITERADCYVNSEGRLCVKDELGDYENVILILQNSETAFEGQFFGLEPVIQPMQEQDINDVILNLKSSRHDIEQDRRTEDTEAKQRLQRLLEQALSKKVSDIHLRLNGEKKTTEISCRREGEFVELMGDQDLEFGETVGFYAAVTLGKKQAFNLQTQVDCTFSVDTKVQDLDSSGAQRTYTKSTKWRMSQIPIEEGSKVTIRALETGGAKLPELGKLGLSEGHVNCFVQAVNSAQGAVLMSGPTGSGKTTTINCALETIKSTRLIHSIEDPVEFSRQGRNHFATPVNEEFEDAKTKQKSKSFEHYGKVLLRHDTDVLYFGEVRDKAAAAQFMRLATTGQVMVGTIHCNNSLSIITTVSEQLNVPITQLAAPGILKALCHQRLVRKLCPVCKIPFSKAHEWVSTDKSLASAIQETAAIAQQEKQPTDHIHFKRINGTCKHCDGRGEIGRTALFEMILIDDKARDFIRNLQLNEWNQHLKSLNWPSIIDHAKAKVLAGEVDYRSVIEQVDGLVIENIEDQYRKMHMSKFSGDLS